MKFLKVQKRMYMDEKRELTEQDCERLLETARTPVIFPHACIIWNRHTKSVSCRL